MSKEKTMVDVADKAIDKVEVLISSVADKATDIFSAAAGIITDTAAKYGPDVVNAVLWVVRLDALQSLVTAFMWIVVSLGVMYFITTGFTKRKWEERIERTSDGFLYAPIGISMIASLVALIFNVGTVTDVWKYTAIIKPELYLTKQVVDVVKTKLEEKTSTKSK